MAQSLATSARQLPKGSLKLLTYYQGTKDQVLNFTVANQGTCAAGGVAFACGQTGDVEGNGNGGMGVVKVLYQPWESFQYYGLFGAGNYSLRVPYNTVMNTLTGDNPGMMWGAGVKSVLVADTQFSPAIAIDAGLAQSRYKFNRRFPGGGAGVAANNNINQALTMSQYQVALEISHVFTLTDAEDKRDQKESGLSLLSSGLKLEPYGGVKWTRIRSDLHDLQDGSHAGGKQDTVSPFAGLRVPVYEHEAFFAEGSFVNGTQYAAGLEVRFK
mgnify:CR=1 FL=1